MKKYTRFGINLTATQYAQVRELAGLMGDVNLSDAIRRAIDESLARRRLLSRQEAEGRYVELQADEDLGSPEEI